MSRATISRRGALAALGAAAIPTACASPRSGATDSARGATLRPREVTAIVDGQPTVEGAGVHLTRMLGTRKLPMLDPFLMLDEFVDRPDDYVAGFPRHPHRGFETVTYMLEGAIEHRDSLGNHGRLGPGSTQWMTAGHGIVHEEMPGQRQGMLWGFQLWVNLPAERKMIAPRYQDLAADRIGTVEQDGAQVRVVAGELSGVRGPVDGIVTAPSMLDVKLGAKGHFAHAVPSGHNVFVHVFDGSVAVGAGSTRVRRGQLAVLGAGDLVKLRSEDGGRALLLAGRPIGEPVARGGPFVMNTDAEIQKAWDDYRAGRLTSGS